MPGRWSSPVCLTVVCFLSWSLPSSAQIWTDEVSGVQYDRLDSNVTLACGKSQTGTSVVWRLDGSSALPWHRVTSDGSLVLLQVDQSAQGNYSCHDDGGGVLHSVTLRLGHPPGLLSVSCQVPNHTHVRCSWVESVQTFLPAQYNASFRGTGQEWRPCIVDLSRKHCDVDHPAFWQTIHTLRITQTNALGHETTYVRFQLHKLLKPDPPESVWAQQLDGFPQRLNVSWSFPSSWPLHDAFPLMFQIRYRPQGSMYWSEIYSEDSSVVIFDALAGHIHQVQVRARDEVNSDSQWSEWTPQLLIRPWEVYTTPDPVDDGFSDYFFPEDSEPETSTTKSHNPMQEDEGNLGLVILLVLFSVVVLTTVLSLVLVWMRQRRRHHATKQELSSMVKMKSIPI